jgi:hypothetical protein
MTPVEAVALGRPMSLINVVRNFFRSDQVTFGTTDEVHALRHLVDRGIEVAPVQAAIRNDLATNAASRPIGQGWTGTVSVGENTINYSAYRLSNRQINVGSIRPQP